MNINLNQTLIGTNGRIKKTFLALSLGRSYNTILNWCNGRKIPESAKQRLIDILSANDVKIIYYAD
jgi:DNA-binding transcriptional regulator YiaG